MTGIGALMLTAKEAALEHGFSPLDVRIRKTNLVVANAVNLGKDRLRALVARVGKRNGAGQLRERLFTAVWDNLQYVSELGSLIQVRESVAQVLDDWVETRAREKGLTKLLKRRTDQQLELGTILTDADRERARQLELERRLLEHEAQELAAELLAAIEAAAAEATEDPSDRIFAEDTVRGLKLLQVLSRTYDVVVMNPPYGAFVPKVKDFVNAAYPLTKNDIYAAFIDRAAQLIKDDEDFFAGLALYRQTYGYGSATTEQFRDVMEAAGGLDLDRFFQQWIYEPNHPVYEYSYTLAPDGDGKKLSLKITQTQDNAGIFSMPLDIRVYSTGGAYEDYQVQNNRAEQWYTLDVAADAISADLDPDDWVLCEKTYQGISAAPGIPTSVARLAGNYPNPFNPSTTVVYELPVAEEVSVVVYDLAGRQVAVLVEGFQPAGTHQAVWNGRDSAGNPAASGVFLVRLKTAGTVSLRKITMVQ